MSNIALLLLCLAAGVALRGLRRVPDDAHATLNAVVVHVSLPALTLHYLHRFDFDAAHLLPVLMPWLLFALGAAVFRVLGHALALPRSSVGALTLLGGSATRRSSVCR